MDLLNNSIRTMRGIRPILKIATIIIVLLGVGLILVACGGQDTQTLVRATWITPQVTGNSVSIPVSEVTSNKIVHFNVPLASGNEIAFMAYNFDGKINVRANVCPPCRSIGFSLIKETLVCDTCRTTFEAKTGEGIFGACISYPKAAVPYEISNGKLVLGGNDLLSAYQDTMEFGLP